MRPTPTGGDFEDLVRAIEPPLRRALVAAFGADLGREAAAEALAWGWEHRVRISNATSPTALLYRVGQGYAGHHVRRRRRLDLFDATEHLDDRRDDAWELAGVLEALSERQRVAVLLVHGHRYTLEETAAVLGCSISTVRSHLDRGLARLREQMKDEHHV
jgi:RNA polymerase sigma factor (sigma-70 family)